MATNGFEGCHKYDITAQLSPYLEPRMLIYCVNWLKSKNIYPEETLTSILSAVENKIEANKLPEEDFLTMEKEYLPKIEQFKQVLEMYKKDQQHRISNTFERLSVTALLQWAKSGPDRIEHDVPNNVDELMMKLAKAYYDWGDYDNCRGLLLYYLNWVAKYVNDGRHDSRAVTLVKNKMTCFWGLISCNVLDVLLPSGLEELAKMSSMPIVQQDPDNDKDASLIDQRTPRSGVYCILKFAELLNAEETVKDRRGLVLNRAWLLHWALFYIFKYHLFLIHNNHKTSKSSEWAQLQEYFMDDRNLAVVNLVAPHLLRYYAAYAMVNRGRKDHFKTITNAKYSDTFTSLLGALFVDFNFDAAQKLIVDMKEVGRPQPQACKYDALLEPLSFPIEESARHIIFETYCRIHKSIKIETIAQNVNMSSLEAERWIVNIIRHSHVEAKIDSEKNCIEISTVPPNLYQQVIEKTQNLTLRSHMILHNLSQMNPNADNSLAGLRLLDGAERAQARKLYASVHHRKALNKFNFKEKEHKQEQEALW